jgi:hypothetical protein
MKKDTCGTKGKLTGKLERIEIHCMSVIYRRTLSLELSHHGYKKEEVSLRRKLKHISQY